MTADVTHIVADVEDAIHVKVCMNRILVSTRVS